MAFDPGLNFYVYWGAAYNLVFADFDNYDTHGEHGERLFFLLVTLAITLVLLNLLIAIISDEYDHVQNTKESQDVLERLILIREVSKYLKFGYGDSLDKQGYIHRVTNEKLKMAEDDKDWEGKVKYLENSILNLREYLQDQNAKQTERINSNNENQIKKMSELLDQINQLKQLIDSGKTRTQHLVPKNTSEQNSDTKLHEKIDKLFEENAELKREIRESLAQHQEPPKHSDETLNVNVLIEKIDKLAEAKEGQDARMNELMRKIDALAS